MDDIEKEFEESINRIIESKSTNLKEAICMQESKFEYMKTMNEVKSIGAKELANGDKSYIEAEINNKEMAAIIFTSGTTSMAKGVMLSHYNIASNIYCMQLVEKAYDTDVNMAFLPFHHTFGSTGLLFFLAHGATNVFCDGLRYIQDNMKEYHVSCFVCVPLLIESIYKKVMHQIEKQGKMKKFETGMKISKFLLKFKIDIYT